MSERRRTQVALANNFAALGIALALAACGNNLFVGLLVSYVIVVVLITLVPTLMRKG